MQMRSTATEPGGRRRGRALGSKQQAMSRQTAFGRGLPGIVDRDFRISNEPSTYVLDS
jgi:hypothetical protein